MTEETSNPTTKINSPVDGIDDLHSNFVGEDHFLRLMPRPLLKTVILMYADEDNDQWPLPDGHALRELLMMLVRHILGVERLLIPALDRQTALRYVAEHAATYKLSSEKDESVNEIRAFVGELKKQIEAKQKAASQN